MKVCPLLMGKLFVQFFLFILRMQTAQLDVVTVGPWCVLPTYTYTCQYRVIHTLKIRTKQEQ